MHKDLKALVKAMVKLTLDRARALKDVQPLVIEKEKKKRRKWKETLIIKNGEVVGARGEGYIEELDRWNDVEPEMQEDPDDGGDSPDCGGEGPGGS